jgi:hypothetical protein
MSHPSESDQELIDFRVGYEAFLGGIQHCKDMQNIVGFTQGYLGICWLIISNPLSFIKNLMESN